MIKKSIFAKKLWFYLKTLNVYIHYHLKKNIPFLVIINPTLACNLKCKFCRCWLYKEIKEIGINKLFQLVDEISEIGTPYISFSGGEPLLMHGIEDIGAYARKKNILVNLNTNGTLIDKKRAQKITTSFDYIRISLNGPEKIHDEVSGVKGTYKKVLKAIDYLTSIPNRKARIGLNYVLTENNTRKIKDFYQKFQEKVDFISFLPEFSFGQRCKPEHSIPKSELVKIRDQLEINGRSGNTKDFIINTTLEYSKKICDAGKLYISIYPFDGGIYACPFLPEKNHLYYKLGSIYKNKLFEILNQKYNNNFSERCIGCYATCTTEISRIFRMPPHQLIKKFFYFKKIFQL